MHHQSCYKKVIIIIQNVQFSKGVSSEQSPWKKYSTFLMRSTNISRHHQKCCDVKIIDQISEFAVPLCVMNAKCQAQEIL